MVKEQCIANLLEMMQQAIDSGDWKVDGGGDPDMLMREAAWVLRNNGWTQNAIDGHWQNAG